MNYNFLLEKRIILFIFSIILFSQPLQAQVVWEDYQGNSRIAGTNNQDLSGPSYANGTGNSSQRLNSLRSISANPSNSVRTGTSQSINYRTSNLTLCNLDSDAQGTSAACLADAQGRVIYAILKFSDIGNYSFSMAHDDDIDIDFSTEYGTNNYRQASYDIPIGEASDYTTNDNTFESIAGYINSPVANSCVLMRIYWNNVGGINHLRLRWTKPNGTTEIIPAQNFLSPGNVSGCNGSISTQSRSLTLNKYVSSSGRAGVNDQFVISLYNSTGTSLLSSATTSGAGQGLQASTGAIFVTSGGVYRITDEMAANSSYPITAYDASISCTLNGSAYNVTEVSLGVWSINIPNTGNNQKYLCNITNSKKNYPPMALQKTSVVYWDPINLFNNPKSVPGAFTNYSIFVNSPEIPISANSVFVTDALPPQVELCVVQTGRCSAPVIWAAGSSGLTYTYGGLSATGDDVAFSTDGTNWGYTPSPNANGTDPAIRFVRVNPKGGMNPNSNFTITLRTLVK